MRLVVNIEITGLDGWSLTKEQKAGVDRAFLGEIRLDIIDSLQEEFGRNNLSVCVNLEDPEVTP